MSGRKPGNHGKQGCPVFCVKGSILYDAVAIIGGLIHLLVPGPNSSSGKFNPENIHQWVSADVS
jgi:hypothetical protein